ncbi:MAG TPA: hypothetical protein VN081_02815 [Dongiaceae bacterium]|nr:hypothetical protein [Dongiaceae bacterium]
MNGLPIDNLEELKESVKMSGFGDFFNEKIESSIRAGMKEFSLDKTSQVEGDQMSYSLDIRIDYEKRKGYLNDLHALIKEANGMERTQRFPRFMRITAKEAYNLLKWGQDTGVEKKLFNKEGEPYRSFISLDINGVKDENGNYPLSQYHERYYSKKPFTIEGALQQLSIPVKELQTNPDFVASSLRRGNMTAVTLFHNDQEEKGFLSVNPKAGRIDVRDQYYAVIETKNQSQSIGESRSQPVTQEASSEDVKKKFSPEKQVNWTQNRHQNQHKGVGR